MQKSGIRGLAAVRERYGHPIVRQCTLTVSAETLAYWKKLKDKRVAEVVLLVRRPQNRYLLHTKAFYPQGVYRLLSGGIKPGEDVVAAAQREAYEETGLPARVERFVGILRQHMVHQGDSFTFTSYLFLLCQDGGSPGVCDDDEEISGYQEVLAEELEGVAEALEALSPDWADWGRFRAVAHRLAAHVLLGEGQG